MDAKQRARILSFPGARQFCDSIVNVGNRRYAHSHKNERLIEVIKADRTSDRCFIVGNGPSLTIADLEAIKNEDCFGANHIYKLFSQTSWRPKYYVIQDRYTVMDRSLADIEAKYVFAGSYYLRSNDVEIPSNTFVYYDRRDISRNQDYLSFSEDISDCVSVNYTVTYSMIQIAFSLGYKHVYLIGIDHTYAVETDDKGAVVKRNDVKSHAYEDVNKEVVANVAGMERAYRSANNYVQQHPGLTINNATRGGHLEVFERVELETLLV